MWDIKIWRYATLSQERQAELKLSNWAQWCHEAAKQRDRRTDTNNAGKQCVDCQWPLDEFPENENNKENRFSPNRCLVCIAINSILNGSSFGRQLEREENFKRKSMGLSDE